ncbi:MAG: hypothetical protein ACLTZY_09220 [Alistipes indistinctus]
MIKALEPKLQTHCSIYFAPGYENEDELLENLGKWVFVEWSKANDFVQDVNLSHQHALTQECWK